MVVQIIWHDDQVQVLVLLILPVLCSASHRRSGASGDVHWKETVKQMGAFRNVAAANAGGKRLRRRKAGRAGERAQ